MDESVISSGGESERNEEGLNGVIAITVSGIYFGFLTKTVKVG